MDLSELISKRSKRWVLLSLINKEKKTAFSFRRFFHRLKGTGIEKTICYNRYITWEFDPLMSILPLIAAIYVSPRLGVVYMNVIVIGGVRVQ